MRFTSELNKDDDSPLYHWFFSVPDQIAQEFLDGQQRRVVVTINATIHYHAAIYGNGNGGHRLLLNRERCKKLGLTKGDILHVELQKDTSEYGVPMSAELCETLDQNPEADRLFHLLSKGSQRTLIYWSDNVKSPDIRIRRALVMSDHVVNQNGKPDFKLLNLEMKAANKVAKRN